MTAIRHFNFTDSINHPVIVMLSCYFNENHSCCSVQFSEFSHSVHSFRPFLQHTHTSGATKHQIGFSK